MGNPNTSIFDAINDAAGQYSGLDAFGKFAAQDLIYIVVALAAVLCLWLLLRNIRYAFEVGVIIVIAVGASLLIGKIISDFWFEARPFIDHPAATDLVKHSADASFPSDHCLVAGAIAMVALLAFRWLGVLAVILAIIIAWARVFVGVHYPGDVVGGLAIGAACGIVAWVVVRRLDRYVWPTRWTMGLLSWRRSG